MRFTQFKINRLFANPQMRGVFPQIKANKITGFSVYKLVQDYIRDIIGGDVKGGIPNVTITVKGDYQKVLRKVQETKPILEGFYSGIGAIGPSINRGAKVYLSAGSVTQIARLKTNKAKLKYLGEVLDNVNYNPDFGALNSIPAQGVPLPFSVRQQQWMQKVGYRENGK